MTARAKNTAPSVEWTTYTVRDAEAALATNDENRTVSMATVRRYARDILHGDWEATGETIKFSDAGKLLDGQHRLLAVQEAALTDPDISVMFLTVYGLPERSQLVMDTGRRRTQSDALQLRGYRNATTVAAAARLIIRYDARALTMSSSGGRNEAVSNSELLTWLELHPEFEPFVANWMAPIRRTELPPSPMTAAQWIATQIDPAKADEFAMGLVTLEDQGGGSPILALHRWARSMRSSRSRLYSNQWLGMIVWTWNKFVTGEAVGRFYLRPTAKFPYPETMYFDGGREPDTLPIDAA